MTFLHHSERPWRLLLSVAATLTGASLASAQVTFSIDYHSSTVSVIDGFLATPITDGDLLTPFAGGPLLGPLASPGIAFTGGALGLATYGPCVGHAPLVPCGIEVDALSFGGDAFVQNVFGQERWFFSVDELAVGIPAFGLFPNVTSEGAGGAALEASADIFGDLGLPPGPLPPFAAPVGNTAFIDGNGMISANGVKYPGLGLLEPNLPGIPPHPGDNLDGVDMEGPVFAAGLTYFSLDSSFIDPKTGQPNSVTALLNGFVSGDVLASPAGGPPFLYAPAGALGLDFFGPDTDDLDALALWENGLPGFQVPFGPYSWVAGGTDMIFFSVRRGSAIIGAPDSFFGVPIEEGDILVPPVFGGASPFPGIWIAAENIGLDTLRNGAPCADDLNALDVSRIGFFINDCNGNFFEDAVEIATGATPDCNRNGVPDSCDIASGASCDANLNSIPDECDWGIPLTYCVGKPSSLGVGCVPSIDWAGTPSASCPSPFFVNASNINNFKNGIMFYGYGPAAIPFLGGTLCVAPPLRRTPIQNSGGSFPISNCTGTFSFDFNGWIQSGIDPALLPGTVAYCQYWFRDPPNTASAGLSNAESVPICP